MQDCAAPYTQTSFTTTQVAFCILLIYQAPFHHQTTWLPRSPDLVKEEFSLRSFFKMLYTVPESKFK